MGLLRALFGPSRNEIWRQLSREVRGQFHERGFFGESAVQARTGDWIMTLDTCSQGGQHGQVYTRLRAPYFNPEGFRFQIYRASVFTELGKALGMEDIEVGHPRFDGDFVIKGNMPRRVRRLFDNPRIRKLIDAQPRIHLSVKAHEGWFSKFPAGVDELHYQAEGVIKDLPQLRTLFDLFAEVLQELCHDGSAYQDDVRIHTRRLRAPGGRIEDTYLLWEGYKPRRDAAAALGRLGDPAAVAALASVLWDADALLRVLAIDALAEIGHGDAIRPLIPLLGDRREAEGRAIQGIVAEALRRLGEGDLTDTVLAALRGDFNALKARGTEYRAEIIAALAGAIEGEAGQHAANALAEINAVEALPRLRETLRSYRVPEVTERAVAATIRKLEARASLPRAAAAADAQSDTLPRAAREPGPDRGTLPRRSRGPGG